MTFLATLIAFAAALTLAWLATQRTGRQHECSCSRSRRVMTEYERLHPRSFRRTPIARDETLFLIPSSAILRNSKSAGMTQE